MNHYKNFYNFFPEDYFELATTYNNNICSYDRDIDDGDDIDDAWNDTCISDEETGYNDDWNSDFILYR